MEALKKENRRLREERNYWKSEATKSLDKGEDHRQEDTSLVALPSYSMSLDILEKLGPRCLFDSHCHLDFIFSWKIETKNMRSVEDFGRAYPLAGQSSRNPGIQAFGHLGIQVFKYPGIQALMHLGI